MDNGPAKAAIYRERASEMRSLADQLKNEHHKQLVLESAANYERMADSAAKEAER